MHRFLFRLLKRRDREGQGLVEYALILVLVTLVVIAVLTLFGRTIAQTYCSVVYQLNPGSAAVKVCNTPVLTCQANGHNTNNFSLHVDVIDGDAPDPKAVVRVEFFRDGDTTPFRTDSSKEYCFPSGSTLPCDKIAGSGVSQSDVEGRTITAIGYDVDGHTGQCTATVP
jgi:pilus assembly protein Flp/PilA